MTVNGSTIAVYEEESTIQTRSAALVPLVRRASLNYCFVLLLLPLLAIPAFIALGRSDFFMHHGASVWVRSNDSIFQMTNRNCDVLIFGDSTAMTGINPEVVESNTGLKTCNIAVTNAVLAVTDNLTLNHYLAHNAKPKVLLVQFSPDGFQRESKTWHRTIYAEGLLELLRHGTPQQAHRILLTHPQESIAFAGYSAGFSAFYVIKDVWFHATHLRSEEDTLTVRNGFFTPPAPPRTSCDTAAPLSGSSQATDFSRALVDDYHSQYDQQSGVVLVNVAPIPSCDQNLAVYSSELNGITSNALLSLPIGLFNDSRHYTAVGSTIVSRLVSEELNEVAVRNPSIVAHTPTSPRVIASLRNVRYPPIGIR
ncbi:hypothetical protein [Granulicella sp. dw_53]|uniref:hypothetical protein n=1 Tax=Granulicella sp. dw_53 TaxID=2719792 RepID=UPI001BD2C2AD|nr:hypothetical protein [Granulicella sp. dw_53]